MFYGLMWWKKPEYLEQTTDLVRVTTTLPYADTRGQTQAAAVVSEGFTPALSRFLFGVIKNNPIQRAWFWG